MTRAGEAIEGRLSGVRRIFLDTAPIIYHVEGVALYQPLTDLIFSRIGEGALVAVMYHSCRVFGASLPSGGYAARSAV